MACCVSNAQSQTRRHRTWFLRQSRIVQVLLMSVIALGWYGIYSQMENWANVFVGEVLGVALTTNTGKALSFFLYDVVKILLLLVMMIYVLGWLRAGLNVERIRGILSKMPRLFGYTLGSIFGAITPFCSCSSIPLFLGFTSAGIPLGVTLSFLFTSPMINEVAVVVLWGLLGPKLTLIYIAVGILAGILGGIFMDAVRADRYLADFLKQSIQHNLVQQATRTRPLTFADRHVFAVSETKEIFRRVAKWVVVGVGVGAMIHGFVPEDWIAHYLGSGQWWTVPTAVVLGMPLYTNVTGIIPVMESLLLKGLPVGTTFAFAMASVAASLPEFLMLRQVMKPRLLLLFFGYLAVIFVLVGYLLNALQVYFM